MRDDELTEIIDNLRAVGSDIAGSRSRIFPS